MPENVDVTNRGDKVSDCTSDYSILPSRVDLSAFDGQLNHFKKSCMLIFEAEQEVRETLPKLFKAQCLLFLPPV